jgi:hypothetical protein
MALQKNLFVNLNLESIINVSVVHSHVLDVFNRSKEKHDCHIVRIQYSISIRRYKTTKFLWSNST